MVLFMLRHGWFVVSFWLYCVLSVFIRECKTYLFHVFPPNHFNKNKGTLRDRRTTKTKFSRYDETFNTILSQKREAYPRPSLHADGISTRYGSGLCHLR